MFLEGDRGGLLSNTWKKLSEEIHTEKQKALLKGVLGWRAAGKTTPENCLPWLAVLGLREWCYLSGCLWPISLLVYIWSDSRSFLVAPVSRPKMDFSWWVSGRPTLASPLLSASNSPGFSFGFAFKFLVGTSSCVTTHASGYYCDWSRQACFIQWFPNKKPSQLCYGKLLHALCLWTTESNLTPASLFNDIM